MYITRTSVCLKACCQVTMSGRTGIMYRAILFCLQCVQHQVAPLWSLTDSIVFCILLFIASPSYPVPPCGARVELGLSVRPSVRPSVSLSSFNSPIADMIYMKYYIGTFHKKLWTYFSFYVALTFLTTTLSRVFIFKTF